MTLTSHYAFLKLSFFGMDKLPHRAVVNLQSAFGKLDNEPTQDEIAGHDPLR
jgi:hypothetical protein